MTAYKHDMDMPDLSNHLLSLFGIWIIYNSDYTYTIMNIFTHSTFSTVQLFFLRVNSKSVSIGSKAHKFCFFSCPLFPFLLTLPYCVSFCCTTQWISDVYSLSPPSWISFRPPHPNPSERLSEAPVLCSGFPPAISHVVADNCQSHSPSSSHSPSPHPCSHVRSLCLHLCSCKWAHLHHFSRFHTYVLVYNIFLFLISLGMTDSRSIHSTINDPISFL